MTERQKIRKTLMTQRELLSPEVYRDYSARIGGRLTQAFPELMRLAVGFYWPIKNEPDLLPLMRAWSDLNKSGFCALLPVIEGKERPLKFRKWHPDTHMATDAYGIPYPAEGEFITPEALLIPCVACDQSGYRLGYGGGYYDRTLAELPETVLRIGVGYAFSCIESIFPQAHDMPLDAWVTELDTIRIK